MTVAAFLHGYPPGWSMGGEISTHRTLRVLPQPTVFTTTDKPYEFEGVQVNPLTGTDSTSIASDAESVGATVLYAHSTLSKNTVRAGRRLNLPIILAVHAPPRFAKDLKQAWGRATVRLYNTEAARTEWRDSRGWVLHPPVGQAPRTQSGPRDAWTLTSSLLNKGATQVLELAKRHPDQRIIIVRSPAHGTHGAPDFEERAAELANVEVWDRVHPNEMGRLWAETRILMVPSRYETYGLSAIEAAWHGIPCVHVKTVHVMEGIGDAAWLLRSRKVEELEAAVQGIEADFNTWSNKAFDRVRELAVREEQELVQFTAQVAALRTR